MSCTSIYKFQQLVHRYFGGVGVVGLPNHEPHVSKLALTYPPTPALRGHHRDGASVVVCNME
jgi:hypothetical protein